MASHHLRHARSVWLVVVVTTLCACNGIFDIHEGTPRPICADPMLIDDMEDGTSDICPTAGRHGVWYTRGDGTSTDLTPSGAPDFKPTLIPNNERGVSRYAAHFTGSGFTYWGALMGFSFIGDDLGIKPFDASATGGITFWLKSNVPVTVAFLTPDTVMPMNGGTCSDSPGVTNCNNHFSFAITAPTNGWKELEIPYLALTQPGGSADFNTRELIGVQFLVPTGVAFDVWVDDVSFYDCPGSCVPTCTDPALPTACAKNSWLPAGCRPAGTVCATFTGSCQDPALIDDMEDGDGIICHSGGRSGFWYSAGDNTTGTLTPSNPFTPSPIPGGRDTSRFASHLTGSGFDNWALMGVRLAGGIEYDASAYDGIQFWMRGNVPVSVNFGIPDTVPVMQGIGTCFDSASTYNCNNHFHFEVTPKKDPDAWVQYTVPFAALTQSWKGDANGNLLSGSAAWNPSRLIGIQFLTGALGNKAFDYWVDDVRFYKCPTCLPTCVDPGLPMACPAAGQVPAGCWPAGTNCSHPPLVNLLRVWGSGASDNWAVGPSLLGTSGVIRHWDGSAWSSVDGVTAPPLWGVWGSGPGDMWAIGDFGSVVQWDGSTWTVSTTGVQASLNDVWGTDANDVWVIANPGTLMHWDGSSWSVSTGGTGSALWDLWGTGPNDVWAAGDAGTLVHWDGASWSPSASGTDGTLDAIWGSAPNDVWAVGYKAGDAIIVHWDGSAWSSVASPASISLNGVWGSGSGDVWAVGSSTEGTPVLHWDGSAWSSTTLASATTLSGIWGSAWNDIWAVGPRGLALHWDGANWSPAPNAASQ